MAIGYFTPLERALGRMKEILFQPFDLTKWFVIGFGCWLARLSNCSGGGGGDAFSWVESADDADAAAGEAIGAASGMIPGVGVIDDLGGVGIALIGCAILFVLVLIPVLLWLSSRGQLIFLDDVVHDRAWIKAPWREYRSEGNSLFVWQLLFVLAALLAIAAAAAPVVAYLIHVERGGGGDPSVAFVVLGMLPILAVAIALGYVQLLLIDFVVPVMYRARLSATAAWGRFLPLLKEHFLRFLIYGLFVFGLYIVVGIGLVLAIVLTCCIGLIVLIIPYIGTVATLPIWVTLRLLPLYFVAQFGPEWSVLPAPAPVAGSPPAGPPPEALPGPPDEPPPLPPPSSDPGTAPG